MRALSLRYLVVAGLALFGSVALGLVASACAATTYKIEHIFSVTLGTAATTPPQVDWSHQQHATVRNGTLWDWDHNYLSSVPVLSAPFSSASTAAASIPSGAQAEAESFCEITMLTTTMVEGTNRAEGFCDDDPGPYDPPAGARSHAAGSVVVLGDVTLASGVVEWEPSISAADTVGGGCLLGMIDPIVIIREDLNTMQLDEDTLLTIYMNVGPGGRCSWINGVLDHDAQESFLEVRAASGWTTLNGTLRLVVSGGLVTESVATGDFSGVSLPTVGASTPFVLSVPEVIAVPYDVGSVPEDDLEITLLLSGGTSEETALVSIGDGVPETSSALLSTPIPNPRRGNQTGTFQFVLSKPDRVWLDLYDARGRHLERSPAMDVAAAGRHELRWSPSELQPGVYWIRLVGRGGPLADTHWIVVR